jgi:hypothetical protein
MPVASEGVRIRLLRRLVPVLASFGAASAILVGSTACRERTAGPDDSPTSDTLLTRGQPSGDNQTGVVGELLPLPIRVIVTYRGAPVADLDVSWHVVLGGGTISAGTVRTDADGSASVLWTLGPSAGTQSVRALVPEATGSPVTFTANATPAAASSIAGASSGVLTGVSGNNLADALRVVVRDAFGNGVEGVGVTWTVTAGTITLSTPFSATNASGETGVGLTFTTPGVSVVTATSPGLIGSPVTFTITTLPAPGSASPRD